VDVIAKHYGAAAIECPSIGIMGENDHFGKNITNQVKYPFKSKLGCKMEWKDVTPKDTVRPEL
jgi:hypothetical protein